ncbi:MAG: hypothetical protein K0R73_1232 [Candidatus Midichloriaceae bacterium]|jgi:hypothetical protein|nr:hypothetical protein [Candidatus Midichloriaceae bacterium]
MLENNQELEVLGEQVAHLNIEMQLLVSLVGSLFHRISEPNFDACLRLCSYDSRYNKIETFGKIEMLKILSTTARVDYATTFVNTLMDKRDGGLKKEVKEILEKYIADMDADKISFKEGVSDEIKEEIKKYSGALSKEKWSYNKDDDNTVITVTLTSPFTRTLSEEMQGDDKVIIVTYNFDKPTTETLTVVVDQQALDEWVKEGCLAAGLPVPEDLV